MISGEELLMLLSLKLIEPLMRTAELQIEPVDGVLRLSWTQSGFVLESAASPDGPWEEVAGLPASPYEVEFADTEQFYRLRD